MKKTIVVAGVILLALATGQILAQAPESGTKPGAPATANPMTMSITGKIIKTDQGYIIQGQTPPELFTILNPSPQVLDRIVKSGKNVTVEAVSVLGDNVNILKIDGKAYKESKTGRSKGM